MRRVLAVVALLSLAACTRTATVIKPAPVAALPRPSSGTPSTVSGQPPLVWVSGQVAQVTSTRLGVVEAAGSRVVIRRLTAGATKFFTRDGARFTTVPPGEVARVKAGTPVCVETLFDGGDYLALRVFLGAACGPRT